MNESASASSRRSWVRRLLWGAVGLAILAGLGAGGAVYFLFQRALPDYSGQVPMPGLGAEARILRDAHGVPHIFAASFEDALRAEGYAHASERFLQMELQRRAGQGRLAEIIGPEMLGVDKLLRTLGLYQLAQSSYTALSPEAQGLFQAYAGGVNAWLTTHRDRLDPAFRLLGVVPEPWQPADSLVWGKLMALQLSKNMELERLRARLAAKYPDGRWQILFPALGDTPVTMAPLRQRTEKDGPGHAEVREALAKLGAFTALDHAASNEWVIAGTRTASGKPILANDPHLGLEAPILWYLVRLVTPSGEVKGASVPGLPGVLLGQNDHIAWGFTTTGSDVQDLFVETLDPDKAQTYRTPTGSQPFDTRTETIHVKGGADVALAVRTTRHGPVLSDIDGELAEQAGPGNVMALAFTGLGDHDTTAEALLKLDRAHSWDEFNAALLLYQTPPQNIVYADTDGNIGFVAPGLVPVRRLGDGEQPVDGASGRYDWIGFMPASQAPRLFNPAAGYVLNANNAIVGPGFPYWLGMDWEEPYRAERLQELLAQADRHDLDRSAAMQADHVSLATRELVPLLLRTQPLDAQGQAALELLRGWDGAMERDRPEPLIFEAWLYETGKLLAAAGLGDDPLVELSPLKARAVTAMLNDTSGIWCRGGGCDKLKAEALAKALTRIAAQQGGDIKSWRWGYAHRAQLSHKFYSHVPLLANRADFSLPSSGDFYTLDRGGSPEMKEPDLFGRRHGAGYRGIYDLADPAQSRFVIATGESGHIFSPHYGDLVPLWSEGHYIALSGTADELRQKGAEELRLEP